MLTVSFLFLALNVIIGRAVHEDVPPVGLSFWRWVLASILFLPFSLPKLREQWPAVMANWKLLVLMAAALILCGNTLVYVGLQSTTALNGGLIPVSRPAIILILAWLLFRGTVTPRQWLGIAIALAGVLTVITRGDPALLIGLGLNRGDLWIFISSVGIASYQTLVPRAHDKVHPNVLLQATMTLGVVLLLPVYLWETSAGRPMEINQTTVAAVLYTGIFASVFAIYLANRGIGEIGPARAGAYNYLQPLFVALIAVTLLGEELRWYHPTALVVVIAGIFISSRKR